MPKIVIQKIIHSERQHVFDIVANYENFQNILPKYYPSIRVRSERDNIAIVEVHLRLGQKELVMTTKHVTKYPESHDTFVLGGDVKGSHISEVYEKSDNGTKLTITADIKLRGLMRLDDILGKSNVMSEFNRMMADLCNLAEP